MDIYLDMDDVVADWITHAQDYLGMKWGNVERIPNYDWARLKNDHRFYSKLDLKPGATELVQYCRDQVANGKADNLAFLSALPHDYSVPFAAQDKVWWAHKHFEGIPVFFGPFSHDKYRHCKPGDILIDDRTSNCIEWRDAGGRSHIYKQWPECKIWLDEIFQG
jgi:hypothetical protein